MLKTNLKTIHPTDITEDYFGSYYCCCLENPYQLDYASQSLCDMLGYTAIEIYDHFKRKYSQMVHEEDRQQYLQFIDTLASKEQTLSLEYRMICKDGHIIYINDIMTSHRLDDGQMYGFAVTADITHTHSDLSADSHMDLAQLIDSCGFLQCTCDKYPKVTYINEQMLNYLGLTPPPKNSNWQDFLKENIFFIIPFEDRDSFKKYLEKALCSNEPIMIEHQLLRSDGSRIALMGWLSVIKNEKGIKEYNFIYMPVTEMNNEQRSLRDNSYLKALKSVYSLIFEINLTTQTVECIHGKKTSQIGTLYDIHMTLESAKNFWINNYIVKEDREMMKDFLDQISYLPRLKDKEYLHQTEFHIQWINHVIYHFIGVAICLDSSTVIFCCRNISRIRSSNLPLKKNFHIEKLYHWLDFFIAKEKSAYGMVLLESSNDTFSLVYISRTIYDYFKFNKEDYLRYLSGELPFKKFLSVVSVSESNFTKLIKSGRLNLPINSKSSSNIKLISMSCTPHKEKDSTLYEILIYDNVPSTSNTQTLPSNGIFARTFGHFDLFVDGIPVIFSSPKEKELMALLIDRNGGTLSSSEAIGYLWENEKESERVSSRYRKLAMKLKNTLTKYGIEHILINNHGVRSINVSALTCDYYELLAGNEQYKQHFHNSYMSDYGWSEETLATLWDYS